MNWPTKKLGEIAKVEWGNTSITKRQYTPSGFLAISAAGPDGFLPFADYEGPAIILSAIGAQCGKCFLVNGKWTAIKNTIVIQPDQRQVDIKYLFYFINDQEKWQRVKAAAQPFISQRNARELEIPLPPLVEQKRIVAKIEKLFAKIDEAQRLRAESLSASSALLPSALHHIFIRVEKEGWKEKTLGEIYEINRGGSPRPIQAFLTNRPDGINWIKIGDAKEDEKYITSTKEKIKPEGLRKTRLVKVGDLILSNSMSFGRPYILKINGAIHDGWLLMRAKTNSVDKEYAYYFLSSGRTYDEFRTLAAGGVVKNLNSDIVRRVKIPLPSVAEQKKIVAYLDSLSAKARELQTLQQSTAADFSALRQSILHSAFELQS